MSACIAKEKGIGRGSGHNSSPTQIPAVVLTSVIFAGAGTKQKAKYGRDDSKAGRWEGRRYGNRGISQLSY
ncbi:UNVERIFIED_CONTAM: hypothetical protein Sradi_1300400 [Sesamum radiatum]|uniref:Uncharacterized protein n=1 Tax=Sesamum radiatum TaxID=300843 RepID=A0AAW2UND6_SESRA